MGSTALLVAALAIIASAGTGGVLVAGNAAHSQATDALVEVTEFGVCIEVLDAVTNEPLAGAHVKITDGDGAVIASGMTDGDGEFEASFYTGSAANLDNETADDCDDINETEDDCVDGDVNETGDCTDDDANETDEQGANDSVDDDGTEDDANETEEQDDVDDDANETADDGDLEASTSSVDESDEGILLDSIVGPITVTVSMDGYVTKTVSYDPTVTDDVDETLLLEPAPQV